MKLQIYLFIYLYKYQLFKNKFSDNDSAATELRSLGFPPWQQFGKN